MNKKMNKLSYLIFSIIKQNTKYDNRFITMTFTEDRIGQYLCKKHNNKYKTSYSLRKISPAPTPPLF